MKKPLIGAPLSRDMSLVLLHLVSSPDRALVRLYSQWWVRESERTRALQGPALQDATGRGLAPGVIWNQDEEVTAFRTTTVKGLVERGLMKFTHGKRRKVADVTVMEYTRAQLTLAALALAESAAADALQQAKSRASKA